MSLLTLYLNLLLMLPSGDGVARIPASASAAQKDPHEVVMAVTVTTLDWHYVTGLRSEDFMILEDRISQQITFFEFKNVPASILVLVDVSGSIEPDRKAGSIIQRVRMKQALEQFVGGFAFHPTTAEELHAIFVLIAGELRWQYLIGFLPATTSDIGRKKNGALAGQGRSPKMCSIFEGAGPTMLAVRR